MLTAEGATLVEYNARFGDPGMPGADGGGWRGDLLEVMLACAEGRLTDVGEVRFREEAALTVVMAARGYPGDAGEGRGDRGLDAAAEAARWCSRPERPSATGRWWRRRPRAQRHRDGRRRGAGAGPRLCGAGPDRLPSGFCRRDIGWREIARLRG
jgi:phosphoribosylamine--glycine ligase